MEEEVKDVRPEAVAEEPKSSKTAQSVVIAVVVTVPIVAVLVYWMTLMLAPSASEAPAPAPKIAETADVTTKEELSAATAMIASLKTELESARSESAASCKVDKSDFPAVVYEREGLLNASDRGRRDKTDIQNKLIDPITDYYNETELRLVALDILVPTEVGREYSVLAIFQDGSYNAFMFGQREMEIPWWAPDCAMGACDFSDAFRAKYPEVVRLTE